MNDGIVAKAAFNEVVAILRIEEDCVVAIAAIDIVVAIAAIDDVVAFATVDVVVSAATENMVVAVEAFQGISEMPAGNLVIAVKQNPPEIVQVVWRSRLPGVHHRAPWRRSGCPYRQRLPALALCPPTGMLYLP